MESPSTGASPDDAYGGSTQELETGIGLDGRGWLLKSVVTSSLETPPAKSDRCGRVTAGESSEEKLTGQKRRAGECWADTAPTSDGQDTGAGAGTMARKTRVNLRPLQACLQCNQAKVKCNGERPCQRCLIRKDGDQCRPQSGGHQSKGRARRGQRKNLAGRLAHAGTPANAFVVPETQAGLVAPYGGMLRDSDAVRAMTTPGAGDRLYGLGLPPGTGVWGWGQTAAAIATSHHRLHTHAPYSTRSLHLHASGEHRDRASGAGGRHSVYLEGTSHGASVRGGQIPVAPWATSEGISDRISHDHALGSRTTGPAPWALTKGMLEHPGHSLAQLEPDRLTQSVEAIAAVVSRGMRQKSPETSPDDAPGLSPLMSDALGLSSTTPDTKAIAADQGTAKTMGQVLADVRELMAGSQLPRDALVIEINDADWTMVWHTHAHRHAHTHVRR